MMIKNVAKCPACHKWMNFGEWETGKFVEDKKTVIEITLSHQTIRKCPHCDTLLGIKYG